MKPLILDTRPIFDQGSTPCVAVDKAVAELRPGQDLVLLIPFEPEPLYAKLRADGFHHRSTELEDGTWRIEFSKKTFPGSQNPAPSSPSKSGSTPCSCG